MTLSKNNKQTKNTETDHGQEEQTWGFQARKGKEWDGEAFGGFQDADCHIWNGWAIGLYCTAQGNMCNWVTLLYSRT